jgi:hypothetical protein
LQMATDPVGEFRAEIAPRSGVLRVDSK